MTKEDTPKVSKGSRLARYGMARVLGPHGSGRIQDNLRAQGSGARDALKIEKLDIEDARAGFNGRYEDGGTAYFEAIMRAGNLGPEDIAVIGAVHRRSAQMFFVSGLFILGFGLYGMVRDPGYLSIASATACVVAFLALSALALRHDFYSWRISERRYGGFREYIRARSRAR